MCPVSKGLADKMLYRHPCYPNKKLSIFFDCKENRKIKYFIFFVIMKQAKLSLILSLSLCSSFNEIYFVF